MVSCFLTEPHVFKKNKLIVFFRLLKKCPSESNKTDLFERNFQPLVKMFPLEEQFSPPRSFAGETESGNLACKLKKNLNWALKIVT